MFRTAIAAALASAAHASPAVTSFGSPPVRAVRAPMFGEPVVP